MSHSIPSNIAKKFQTISGFRFFYQFFQNLHVIAQKWKRIQPVYEGNEVPKYLSLHRKIPESWPPSVKFIFSLKSLKQLWEVVVRHRLLSFFYQVNSLAFIQKNLGKISPGIHETVLWQIEAQVRIFQRHSRPKEPT